MQLDRDIRYFDGDLPLLSENDIYKISLNKTRDITAGLGKIDIWAMQWFTNLPSGTTNGNTGVGFVAGICSLHKTSLVRGPDRTLSDTAGVSKFNFRSFIVIH